MVRLVTRGERLLLWNSALAVLHDWETGDTRVVYDALAEGPQPFPPQPNAPPNEEIRHAETLTDGRYDLHRSFGETPLLILEDLSDGSQLLRVLPTGENGFGDPRGVVWTDGFVFLPGQMFIARIDLSNPLHGGVALQPINSVASATVNTGAPLRVVDDRPYWFFEGTFRRLTPADFHDLEGDEETWRLYERSILVEFIDDDDGELVSMWVEAAYEYLPDHTLRVRTVERALGIEGEYFLVFESLRGGRASGFLRATHPETGEVLEVSGSGTFVMDR